MIKKGSNFKKYFVQEILCFIISVMLIAITLPVFAAETPVLSVGSASGNRGSSVTVNITLDKPKDIAGIHFSILYKRNILNVEESGISCGPDLNSSSLDKNVISSENSENNEIKVSYTNVNGINKTSPIIICSVLFNINNSAPSGPTQIEIDPNSISFASNSVPPQDVKVTASNNQVVVNEGPSSSPGPTGGSSNTQSNHVQGMTVTVAPTTDSSGNAAASATADQIADLLGNMAAGTPDSSKSIEIHVPVDVSVKQVNLTIPKAAFSSINNSGANEITISTGIGTVSFDAAAIAAINNGGTGDISLTIGRVDPETLPQDVRNIVGSHPVYSFTVKSGNTVLSGFNGGNASVEIPYSGVPGEDANAVVVYFINGDGKLSTVNLSNQDTSNGRVTFTTSHFSKYAVGYNRVSFSDTQNHWSSSNITYLAARGIIVGVGNGKFAPDSGITRAEAAKMLAGILNENVISYTSSKFSDVKTDAWYFPYVSWAAANGIASGSEGKFSPNDPLTREQMAVMITRFASAVKYKLPATVTASNFADENKISSWAASAVKTVQAAGIISGKPGNLFDPQSGATRAEAAKMLTTLMKGIVQ